MSDEQHEHTFDSTDAGASTTYPMQCSALRKGGHVVIKGRPCKIVDMSTSKTGKHGHAKVHLVAIDIFTNKKLEDLSPSTHNMDVPNVTNETFELIDIEGDGFLQLMDSNGEMREDIKLPEGSDKAEEVAKEIRRLHELKQQDENKEVFIVVTKAMGEEVPTQAK
ncbi:Eukaryotic translation initiation factor 5A [Pyricularia oryzae]|uniref:Eukaryotic translation initiation factor 5A n=5 Tax=Pyricularia TaxID=48558 RepID=A0ABQ8NXG0_PYRGI|nr:eukaryotic translation initiation factor 5A [Pyricularia oryzae 70-15]ADD84577.1 initiation factor 5A [Pyricularia oryzae]ELQ39943.1 eukaryotic translation initiation factor 5A [Pyricularia oryzae Y34]KAI6302992.1 Eukaryotic translation initiation factor 5A [Pyricularia grisea]EHA52059.1 eukaryotic translation initiation factor 5A [Pyricularia oryzae 70-15]KAH8847308.1 Eukaryotic translation initiation factor 5A [Pyricularia oryzae]